jgi:hypothetical protein
MLPWGAPAKAGSTPVCCDDVTPETEPDPLADPWANSSFGVESGAGNRGREEDYLTDMENPEEPLRETSEHHEPYQQVAPNYEWWDRYPPEMTAVAHADTPEDAFDPGGRYMEEVRDVLPT